MIGLIGAMPMEVDGLKACMQHAQEEIVAGIPFYRGEIAGVACVVACSGVGKVNAAMCAQIMALRDRPWVIVNTGVAGGISRGIAVGDVVLATGLVQHDVDTTAVGDAKGYLSGVGQVELPVAPALLGVLRAQAERTYDGAVHTGIVATGDQFVCGKLELQRIATEFGAIACEMEGGSIAQVCFLNQIDCAVVRAISDNADEEAHAAYGEFAPFAARKSVELLCGVLPELEKLYAKMDA